MGTGAFELRLDSEAVMKNAMHRAEEDAEAEEGFQTPH